MDSELLWEIRQSHGFVARKVREPSFSKALLFWSVPRIIRPLLVVGPDFLSLRRVFASNSPHYLERKYFKTVFSVWKRIKSFPSTLENTEITGHSRYLFEENSGREITWFSWRHRFRKAPFSKFIPSTVKRKGDVLNFFSFHSKTKRRRFQILAIW